MTEEETLDGWIPVACILWSMKIPFLLQKLTEDYKSLMKKKKPRESQNLFSTEMHHKLQIFYFLLAIAKKREIEIQ